VFGCTFNFFKISNNNYFEGNFHQKYKSSCKKLEAEFWPNRLNALPILDRTGYWFIYEDKSNSFTIINGNYQKFCLNHMKSLLGPAELFHLKQYDTFF
jgi:hypothetical protein